VIKIDCGVEDSSSDKAGGRSHNLIETLEPDAIWRFTRAKCPGASSHHQVHRLSRISSTL